jgi:hypothetical protein
MNISQDELRKAATSSGISSDQADLLWQALQTNPTPAEKPKFDAESERQAGDLSFTLHNSLFCYGSL